MVLEPRYIKDSGYDMEDDFMDALHRLPPMMAYKIGKYIEDYVVELPPNDLCTYVVGGVIDYNETPVPFALEIMKTSGMLITLTNLILISMDDYLDLINLNSYIKSNEKNRQFNYSDQHSFFLAGY